MDEDETKHKPDIARLILLVWITTATIFVFGLFVGLGFGDWSVLITVALTILVAVLLILWDIRMRIKAIYDKLGIEDESHQSLISQILRWNQ